MDVESIDTLSRMLADPRSLRAALIAMLGGTLSLLGLADTPVKKGKGKHGKGKKGKSRCGATAQAGDRSDCLECTTIEDCPLAAKCLLPQGVCVIGCDDSSHCSAGNACTNGGCFPIIPEPDFCEHDSDCPAGQYCNNNFECYTP
jgi:hypothetical protein